MDESDNIVSLDIWKKERELEKGWDEDLQEDQSEYSGLPVMLASAYARGVFDGKRHKWMEIRLHILTLIVSNFLSIAVIWWLASKLK